MEFPVWQWSFQCRITEIIRQSLNKKCKVSLWEKHAKTYWDIEASLREILWSDSRGMNIAKIWLLPKLIAVVIQSQSKFKWDFYVFEKMILKST